MHGHNKFNKAEIENNNTCGYKSVVELWKITYGGPNAEEWLEGLGST